jgi:hypothetical protein
MMLFRFAAGADWWVIARRSGGFAAARAGSLPHMTCL